ncbi:MAG: hypothetical protein ACRCWR_12580, partial [Saezia sp.]
MPESKNLALPKQQTISQLMQQASNLGYFTFFCLPGFFIIALTAILPFNIFVQNNQVQNNALIASIPLILGCTFLLALIMSMLAVVILFGSGDLKKQIAFFSRNPTLEKEINKKLKWLRVLRGAVVFLFICAATVNIGL